MREAPSISSKQQPAPYSEQPVKDVHIPDDVNILDSEDIDVSHLPKIKTRPDWLKPADALAKSYEDLEENKLLSKTGDIRSFIKWFCKRIGKKKLSKSDLEECHRLLTEQVELVNPEGHRLVPDVSKPLPLGGPPSQILSVISIKTFERYEYAFLRDIVIRRADYNEYKISKTDNKNLHLNDFEDLYLLHLQGMLNHLPGSDKTKFNVTESRWDGSNILFKEDYTIISKPRAVIYKDGNDQKKMLRENKVHKFSDSSLTRVLHKLDHMVKDFRLYQYNLSMEYRI
nr:hypothetical protein [Tanacetum cinerariifolium]